MRRVNVLFTLAFIMFCAGFAQAIVQSPDTEIPAVAIDNITAANENHTIYTDEFAIANSNYALTAMATAKTDADDTGSARNHRLRADGTATIIPSGTHDAYDTGNRHLTMTKTATPEMTDIQDVMTSSARLRPNEMTAATDTSGEETTPLRQLQRNDAITTTGKNDADDTVTLDMMRRFRTHDIVRTGLARLA